MFNFVNLYKRIVIFGVKHYSLGKQFDYFQPYSIKMINEKKNQTQTFSSFRPIFDFEPKPSRAENLSAQAMARASSARTHHYYLA